MSGKKVDRNEIEARHFRNWIDWAKSLGIGLDFNPTCFSHPKAEDGFTLSHRDPAIRQFWIEHCIACRKIGESFGRELGTPAVTTLGMGEAEMKEIAAVMTLILKNTTALEGSKAKYSVGAAAKDEARGRVAALLARYPVYPELDLDFLKRQLA